MQLFSSCWRSTKDLAVLFYFDSSWGSFWSCEGDVPSLLTGDIKGVSKLLKLRLG